MSVCNVEKGFISDYDIALKDINSSNVNKFALSFRNQTHSARSTQVRALLTSPVNEETLLIGYTNEIVEWDCRTRKTKQFYGPFDQVAILLLAPLTP